MYLSEENRAAIRKCIESQRSDSELNPEKNKETDFKKVHDTAEKRKVSQILFDARDGKEIFTPF